MVKECPECSKKMDIMGTAKIDEGFCILLYCEDCDTIYSLKKETKNIVKSELEYDDISVDLIVCKLCKSFITDQIRAKKENKIKDNSKNFHLRHVFAKGNTNRFYCNNHPLKTRSRYEFRYKGTITQNFITWLREWGLYNLIRYKQDRLLAIEFLLQINIPQTYIAKIIEVSRPTLNKIINENRKFAELRDLTRVFPLKITWDKNGKSPLSKMIVSIVNIRDDKDDLETDEYYINEIAKTYIQRLKKKKNIYIISSPHTD